MTAASLSRASPTRPAKRVHNRPFWALRGVVIHCWLAVRHFSSASPPPPRDPVHRPSDLAALRLSVLTSSSHRSQHRQHLQAVKMVLAVDLLNPTPQAEARKHKLKMLVPAPRSFFMDVKCPGCFAITTVFSHAQTVVICAGCSTVLCQPTGGKARLTEGCSFRRK
ncbi:40S ribosomal protein S27 [Blastomyces dermatitidis ER-3]|uniref:40S ribosomal protein S27 n=2 Tax=Blastomyces TaxID=229219 RepID=A0A179USW7_BLAGS|nr:40S ribosomal protein S27 [Blastomyces gilchristii SLH14081]XP_045277447.1 40S ribosomal protein S27 [Blastomyces dermatitidis ER-3]EEQ90776.2 40S ribosomal protein S27 [Blastomyces dermatitidis ER-3]OAT10960.1 40S ribosomal protein S27 [Blastomyces gilchristii SLH14081]